MAELSPDLEAYGPTKRPAWLWPPDVKVDAAPPADAEHRRAAEAIIERVYRDWTTPPSPPPLVLSSK